MMCIVPPPRGGAWIKAPLGDPFPVADRISLYRFSVPLRQGNKVAMSPSREKPSLALFDLTGKTALRPGAAGGIGTAFARGPADAGTLTVSP
jgi:hypothetical protein